MVALLGTIAIDCNVVTVTVATAVTDVPAAFVTVRVYVVLAVGVTVFATLLKTVPTPLSMLPEPFEKTAMRALDPPCFTDVGDAA